MSKTIDMLNEVENKRMKKYSMALLKTVAQKSVEEPTHSLNEWRTKVILIVIIMTLLLISFQFSVTIKEFIAERKDSLVKLNSMEIMTQEKSRQIKEVNDKLNALNLKFQGAEQMIADLKEQNEAQIFAISNLNKAKNTLFNKVNDLEAKLELNNAQEIVKQ
jgi:hypothetical protein